MDGDELRRLWREAGAAHTDLPAPAAPTPTTFMAALAGSADSLLGADVAVVGLPLGGWSEAPAAVRAASQRYGGWLTAACRETGGRLDRAAHALRERAKCRPEIAGLRGERSECHDLTQET